MQLVDDLKDWREDLLHHRYNSMLSLIVSNNPEYAASLSPDDVVDAIYNSDILKDYEGLIREYAEEAVTFIGSLGIDPWVQLVDSLPYSAAWIVERYDTLMDALVSEHLDTVSKGN